MKTVTLHGGTRDGEHVLVNTWQKLVYVQKRLTLAEANALRIDDFHAWKEPDEVYERDAAGVFRYARTVEYKP